MTTVWRYAEHRALEVVSGGSGLPRDTKWWRHTTQPEASASNYSNWRPLKDGNWSKAPLSTTCFVDPSHVGWDSMHVYACPTSFTDHRWSTSAECPRPQQVRVDENQLAPPCESLRKPSKELNVPGSRGCRVSWSGKWSVISANDNGNYDIHGTIYIYIYQDTFDI